MLRKLKKILISKLHSQKYFDVFTIFRIQLYFLNRLERTTKGIFKIKKISDLKPLKNILKENQYHSKTQKNLEVKVPDLNIYQLNNVIIHSRSSAIIKGKNIYYESINNNERFNEGLIIAHTKKNILIDIKNVEETEEGFFLGGNGSFNWYHWMMEILPKMMYFKEVPINTILVDESCKSIPSMMASLKVFTENLEVKVIHLDRNKLYKVKKLFHINEVNKLIYNELNSSIKETPLFYYRKESLLQFREIFTKNNFSTENAAEKIYLQRKNTHRIAENETEIWDLLQNKNFEAVDLTNCTLSQQICIFGNAKIIVGTTGAAFTNLLFCKPNSYVIIFMPDNYKNYNFYQELGVMLDLKIKYLYYENGSDRHDNSNFRINEDQLNNLYNQYENTPIS